MRTLNLNKTKLWFVEPTGVTLQRDSDNNFTGVNIITYSVPTSVMINFYPYTGDIKDQIFGKDASFDMIGVTNELEFKDGTLFFLTEPIGDYGNSYDYSMESKFKSINTTRYGFKRRV